MGDASAVESEPDDVSMVDAALMQDRIDDFQSLRVESVPDDPKPKMVEAPEKLKKEAPKSGIPSVEEWQDFIGRIVLRSVTDAFLSLALRDFEDDLTPREREMIRLSKEDLNEMSAPLASLAQKSKFGRKNGRAIIAAADSSEAVIALLIWMRRVNKISNKYRKQRRRNQPIPGVVESEQYGNPRSNDGQGSGYGNPPGFGIFNPGTG